MEIHKFIERANAEFLSNGRSKKFVNMEDKVLGTNNTLLIYFYARYTRGVDISKFQKHMEEYGSLDECYYFGQYIDGANIEPFISKAIAQEDEFWSVMLIELGERLGQINNGDIILENLGIARPKHRHDKPTIDIDLTISHANHENEVHGNQTAKFKNLERKAIHFYGDGNLVLCAKYIEGIDYKAVQKSAIMRGNPLVMFMLGHDVPQVDKLLMIQGLKLARIDYKQIDREREKRQHTIETIKNRIRNAVNAEDREECIAMLDRYTSKLTYRETINTHIAQLQDMIIESIKDKK